MIPTTYSSDFYGGENFCILPYQFCILANVGCFHMTPSNIFLDIFQDGYSEKLT